jgi:two-component system chemotaxis sensor kinase CheA
MASTTCSATSRKNQFSSTRNPTSVLPPQGHCLNRDRKIRTMSDHSFPGDLPADEMADYIRLYLDETEEQLDGLVETFLQLEGDPTNNSGLNEAFRLIHSIKGSSALLGLDRITTLTHHLETHFERLRSGHTLLDTATINVVLKCIDFLRGCNEHLRAGEPMESAGDLLDQVKELEHEASQAGVDARPVSTIQTPASPEDSAADATEAAPAVTADTGTPTQDEDPETEASATATAWRVSVALKPDLPMAEMKAELIASKLGAIGKLLDCQPSRDLFAEASRLEQLEFILETDDPETDITSAAHVDGVETIRLEAVPAGTKATPITIATESDDQSDVTDEAGSPDAQSTATPSVQQAASSAHASGHATVLAETVRVDVDRLDVLLNLTGELVVNRARISQLAEDVAPSFHKSGLSARANSLADTVRELLTMAEKGRLTQSSVELQELESRLNAFEAELEFWDTHRQTFSELTASIDQLTRVSNSLQRGVLNTRMVPVGPLFNRFKRSIRDIANELDKRVHLAINGDKTELDKRMIDELGDPLNHLIRNSIDHGIEAAEVRLRHGKTETATVTLTASHRGNNVFITVEDDGGGIDTTRVRQIAVKRGLITQETANSLADEDIIELIFQPGFSTAKAVSDISGRGVGMDIVRTKISRLNGTIDVESTPGQGTRFTIRLPLTLTITRCMLFRLAYGVLAVPIENVREIISVAGAQYVDVNGQQLCDIRGELLQVVTIDDLFEWSNRSATAEKAAARSSDVVVLNANNRSLGLRVDALLGGQDIVVKPLDENFTHIRGLGGASILGDGSVCLLLDVATCIELAGDTAATEVAVEA